jgi:hypothetical protein
VEHSNIISELAKNKDVFFHLLTGAEKETYLWRNEPGKWCLLEIICHLFDEEREDFRSRMKQVIENPAEQFPRIHPEEWVGERDYISKYYVLMLRKFIEEREASVEWLMSLSDEGWSNIYNHPESGEMTAYTFLINWLAHDYLHIKQIIKLKYDYLQHSSGESLTYAEGW